jgi:Uma2 family endonuclease
MSFAEAARLDPDAQGGELDAGRWVPVTRNTWRHGQIVSKANFLLFAYTQEHPGWSLSVGDPGTKLGHDPDRLRGPDLAMVRKEREPTGRGAGGWLEGAPDVVVEVIGDSQSHADLAKKALEYLAAGAKVVWVLDSDASKVIVYTPPDRIRVLATDEMLDGAEVLPGFRCCVAELFSS